MKKGEKESSRKTHGHSSINCTGTPTRTYKAWQAMFQRCKGTNKHDYVTYFKKGIQVCRRWKKFENFLSDMGICPEGKSLNRLDNNKNYCKSNCNYATAKEQAINRYTTKLLTYKGETLCLSDWSIKLGLNRTAVSKRLRRGLSIQESLKEFK